MFNIASKRFPRGLEITTARSWAGPSSPLAYSLNPLTSRTAQTCGRLTSTEAVHNTSSTNSPHTPPRPSNDSPEPNGPGGTTISDHEWNLRAGRAVHTLRVTMPTFFKTGLISSVDPSSPSPSSEPTPSHSDSIYAANIRLCYSPPASLSLPSPFPKSLQVEGLPLYHASAAFIRHTLSAFNTDLHVELRKLHVRSPRPRHREIVLHKGVSGKSRISGARNEWDIHSTYTLSPHTGLIEAHVVESIHPAPHVTFYDGLRAALARLAGVPTVEVGREAGAGARSYDVGAGRALQSVPLRQEIKKTEGD